jgi:hypothetical protein
MVARSAGRRTRLPLAPSSFEWTRPGSAASVPARVERAPEFLECAVERDIDRTRRQVVDPPDVLGAEVGSVPEGD